MYKLLKDVATYSKDRIDIESVTIDSYVTTDNLLQNKEGKVRAEKMPAITGKITKYDAGDILIANIRPYLKKIWFADSSGGSSADVLTLKVKVGYNPKFVYYSLFRDDFFTHVMNGSKGTKMPRGDKRQILDFSIPNFPILKQDRIAKVLSDLDAKIDLNNRINSELEGMAKLIYDYWFVQFDFPISEAQADAMGRPELKGKPYKSSGGKMVFNKELKREVPEGWEFKELGSFMSCNYSNISKDDNYLSINYLDTSNLTENVISDIKQIDTKKEKVPSRAQRVVNNNDILYSTVRPNQRHYGIIKNPVNNLIASTGYAQLTSEKDYIRNEWVYMFLSSDRIVDRLQQIAELSVSSYPSISANDILALKVVVPKSDKASLKSFNKLAGEIYTKIDLNLKENKTLCELRGWLLPMLMNGQVRVMGDEVDVRIAAEPGGEYGGITSKSL